MGFILDASKYQNQSGAINWDAVKRADCLGVIIKATQGTTLVDPYASANHSAARAAGLPVAPYHFSNDGNPVSEAAHFANCWNWGWDFRPWLDEELPTASASFVNQFRSTFRGLTAEQLFGVYSSLSLMQGPMKPSGYRDASTGLWVARYNTTLGWNDEDLLIWQFSSSATVPGVLGHVDESELMNGWTPAADRLGAKAVTEEDDMGFQVQVTGTGDGTEQSVQVPAVGMGFINFSLGFGNQLTVKQALCFSDTPVEPMPAVGALAPVHPAGSDWVIDNDRPGPVPLPQGVRTVSVLFTCAGNATIWTSTK